MVYEFTKAALYGISNFNKKVKEKIGTMKLIELLNEYCGEDEWTIECDVPHNDWYSGYAYEHEELIIISKQYGFIKWLVENDKIDKDNEELISLMSELGEFEQYEKCLLMLLATQDEPIRFLCEILK